MNKKIREEIVAKLAAVDGFPPSAVCKSEFICQAFSDKGMLFKKNLNHFIQLVYKQYENETKLKKAKYTNMVNKIHKNEKIHSTESH